MDLLLEPLVVAVRLERRLERRVPAVALGENLGQARVGGDRADRGGDRECDNGLLRVHLQLMNEQASGWAVLLDLL